MKKLVLSLLLGVSILTTGCEVEEFNQDPATDHQTHISQAEVPDHMIGKWKTIEGIDQTTGNKLLQGHMEITKELVCFQIELHTYHLILEDYTTVVNEKQDCYFYIYFTRADGTVLHIRISDCVVKNGQVLLKFDGQLLAIFLPDTGEVQPTPVVEDPILN